MFGYYRSFIHQFAKIAKPLNDLKKNTSTDKKPKPAYNSKAPIEWDDNCERAFVELKKRLCTAPILAHPQFDRPFILYTDASAEAFAAVLTQVWEKEDYIGRREEKVSAFGKEDYMGPGNERETRKDKVGKDMVEQGEGGSVGCEGRMERIVRKDGEWREDKLVEDAEKKIEEGGSVGCEGRMERIVRKDGEGREDKLVEDAEKKINGSNEEENMDEARCDC